MSFTKVELVEFRIKKAEKCLEEAIALAVIQHWDAVVNRLYYASFHAISAYLANCQIDASTHKGVKLAFHKELIKTGLLNEEYGRFYSDLFNKRQEADYTDFIEFDDATIRPLILETNDFVGKIKNLLPPKHT